MTSRRCGVVVTARNEEKAIGKCLESLRNQTIELFLVVVNDGSKDKTKHVASKYADVVVDLPRHKESWTGRPEFAKVINAGLDVLKQRDVEYILTSGSDTFYPSNYAEEIVGRMEKEGITIASGMTEGEAPRSLSPRGSGRVLEADWFRSVGFQYPENYGFEVYHIYKALSQGRKVAVLPDLKFYLSRKTTVSRRKLYLWGKGMKALNYWWLYALGRAVLAGLRLPSNGFELLKGYMSNVPEQYEDLKEFIPNFQKKLLAKRIIEIFGM